MDGPLTFLCLPVYIRIKIYRLGGLVQCCPIDLSFESAIERAMSYPGLPRLCRFPQLQLKGSKTFQLDLRPGLECFCPPLPHQLLYVSHAIHDEVLPLMYGENMFKVSLKKNDLPNHNLNSLWV